MRDEAHAAWERQLAMIAGLILLASGLWMIGGSHRDGERYLIAACAPPFLMGGVAAAMGGARTERWRQRWITVAEVLVVMMTMVWGTLGILFVFPALVVWAMAAAFFGIERHGTTAERPGRALVAIGTVWTPVF